MTLPIDPSAKPIGHRSPYRPIDFRFRKAVITLAEWMAKEGANGKVPDAAAYRWDSLAQVWRLK